MFCYTVQNVGKLGDYKVVQHPRNSLDHFYTCGRACEQLHQVRRERPWHRHQLRVLASAVKVVVVAVSAAELAHLLLSGPCTQNTLGRHRYTAAAYRIQHMKHDG